MRDNTTIKDWGISALMARTTKQHVDLASIVPGGYCSVHYHLAKNNLFYVIQGSIFVHIFDGDAMVIRQFVNEGECYDVGAGVKHRFWSQNGASVCEIYTPTTPNGILLPHDADDIFRFSTGGISEKEPSLCQP